jgi:predicted membrane protein (TIGR00267 family)
MGNDEVAKIARRYLVMNSFDGVLTILGVVVGTFIAEGFAHPNIVLSAGFGASIAMGISGAMGTYLIEKAERTRENTSSEDELKKDVHEDSLFLALVDGLSPAFVTLIAIVPFLLALKFVISVELAFVLSVTIIALELFGLGAFLGKISGKSIISHGLITLLVGVAVFLAVSSLPI